MMKQRGKKAISWLLSLAMILGMLPGFTLPAKAISLSAGSMTGGTVAFYSDAECTNSLSDPSEGSTVYVKVTADSGYKLKSIQYGATSLMPDTNGVCSFTMPAAETTVTTEFVQIHTITFSGDIALYNSYDSENKTYSDGITSGSTSVEKDSTVYVVPTAAKNAKAVYTVKYGETTLTRTATGAVNTNGTDLFFTMPDQDITISEVALWNLSGLDVAASAFHGPDSSFKPSEEWTVSVVYDNPNEARPTLEENPNAAQIEAYESAVATYESTNSFKTAIGTNYKVYTNEACTEPAGGSASDAQLTVTTGESGNNGEFYVKSDAYGDTVDGYVSVLGTSELSVEKSEHGTVEFQKTVNETVYTIDTAYKGETVTVKVTSDDGYQISNVTAKDKTNNPCTVTATETPGMYTLSMPGSDTKVTVEYTQASYAITQDVSGGGSITTKVGTNAVTTAKMGDTVTVEVGTGYAIDSIRVTKTGTTGVDTVEVPTSGKSFYMPAFPVTVTAVTYAEPNDDAKTAWHCLNDDTYKAGATLSTGRYYLTADKVFNGSSAEKGGVAGADTGNGLKIAYGATVYIYLNNKTLSAYGKDGSGVVGGYAGIYVPDGAKLYFVGDGTVVAVGGKGGNGGNGNNGNDGYAYASAGGGALGFGGSAYATASGGAGGAGGNGGGGAGAGIGTNGGSGAWANSGTARKDGSSAANAGKVVFLGVVNTDGVTGGASGANGAAASHGAAKRAKDTAKKLLKNLKCSASAQGGGAGSPGAGGDGGSKIGAGGTGGSGGGHGTQGQSTSSNSSHDKYSTYYNSNNASGAAIPSGKPSAASNTNTSQTYAMRGISANTKAPDNQFEVGATINDKTGTGTTVTEATQDTPQVTKYTGVLQNLTVTAYYSKTSAMKDYAGQANDADNWIVLDVPFDKIDGVSLANQTSTVNNGALVKGGNLLTVSYDPGSLDGSATMTAELNVMGRNDDHPYEDDLDVYGDKADEAFTSNTAAKYDSINAVKVILYDNKTHNLAQLFDTVESAEHGFGNSWSHTYAVLYTPYNSFKDSGVSNKAANTKPASFASTQPEQSADNWLLGGKNSLAVEDYFPTATGAGINYYYFDGTGYGSASAYDAFVGNNNATNAKNSNFGSVTVKNAGLYTIYERVLEWKYNSNGTYTSKAAYNTYYVVIQQADLAITQASDVVSETTKVQNHIITRFVEGQNGEQVYGRYFFNAGYDALWGNDENLTVNANTPIQSNLKWEFNLFGSLSDNDADQYTDVDGTTVSYGSKSMNNYLCQNDGASAIAQKTATGDVQNTYYKGENGVISYNGAATQAGDVAKVPASMNVTVTYVKDQNTSTAAAPKTFNSETVSAADYPGPTFAAKNDDKNFITSVFGEDIKIKGELTQNNLGWRVVVGDQVTGSTLYGTKVKEAPKIDGKDTLVGYKTGESVKIIDLLIGDTDKDVDEEKDNYLGDLYVITVKGVKVEGDKTTKLDVCQDYVTDNEATKAVYDPSTNHTANVISKLAEQAYNMLPACEFYGVDYYEVSVDYVGLYYTTQTSSAGRAWEWSGLEEFQWVVSGVRFYLDVAQREVTLKDTADFNKIYDGTTALVKQGALVDGDVTSAAPYVVELDRATAENVSPQPQFTYNPAKILNNYKDPTGGTGMLMGLEVMGEYDDKKDGENVLIAAKDKGAVKPVTITAARFLMTEDEYDYLAELLGEEAQEARAGSKVPQPGDQAAALNYVVVDGNGTDAEEDNGIATVTGNIDVAQMHFEHAPYGELDVYDTTPMHEALKISAKAYLLTVPEKGTDGFYGSFDGKMVLTELVEKNDEKTGDAEFTVNGTAFDYNVTYEIERTALPYRNYLSGTELTITSEEGKVTAVAMNVISAPIDQYPAINVTVKEFKNFKLVSGETADPILNNCTKQADADHDGDDTNDRTYSGESWKHVMRFIIRGNDSSYDLLLPMNMLNTRAVMSDGDEPEVITPYTPSKFLNRSGNRVTDAAGEQLYDYIALYPNGDSAEFYFTIPQDSYLADVQIVAVKNSDGTAYKTYPKDAMPAPAFESLVITESAENNESNVISTFSTQVAMNEKYGTTFAVGDSTGNVLYLKLEKVNDQADFTTTDLYYQNADPGDGNRYTAYKLAAPNNQKGGSSFQFQLETGAMNLGPNYAIAVVPVIKPFDGKLLGDHGTTKYESNLTVEKQVTSAEDSTLTYEAAQNDYVYVNYETLFDTNAFVEETHPYGTITMSYKAPAAADSEEEAEITYKKGDVNMGDDVAPLTWNLTSPNLMDKYYSFGINTEADGNLAFFNPGKLLPGTKVTVKLDVWRNGVRNALDVATETEADPDAFDSVTFTWTVSEEDYYRLFKDDMVIFRSSNAVEGDEELATAQKLDNILGYVITADDSLDFAKIPAFYTNHSTGISVEDTETVGETTVSVWSVQTDFDVLATYADTWYMVGGKRMVLTANNDGTYTMSGLTAPESNRNLYPTYEYATLHAIDYTDAAANAGKVLKNGNEEATTYARIIYGEIDFENAFASKTLSDVTGIKTSVQDKAAVTKTEGETVTNIGENLTDYLKPYSNYGWFATKTGEDGAIALSDAVTAAVTATATAPETPATDKYGKADLYNKLAVNYATFYVGWETKDGKTVPKAVGYAIYDSSEGAGIETGGKSIDFAAADYNTAKPVQGTLYQLGGETQDLTAYAAEKFVTGSWYKTYPSNHAWNENTDVSYVGETKTVNVASNGSKFYLRENTVESITITNTEETMKVGDSIDLTATITPFVDGTVYDGTMVWKIYDGRDYATLDGAKLTATNAGTVTVRVSANGYNNAYADKVITITGSTGSGSGGSGSGSGGSSSGGGGGAAASAASTITVPVSGDQNTVAVSAKVSGTVATMAQPTANELNKVIGQSVGTGEVIIDMSGLGKDITTAVIPAETFKAIETAVSNEINDAEKLTVKVSDGSATFDAAALTAVAGQATGSQVELKLDSISENSLKAAQKTALKDVEVEAVYDIYLTSNGKRISDFNGGSSTITVSYTLKNGQVGKGIVVWYVADDGSMTEVPAAYSNGKVTFTVPHFSNYVIAYDAARAAACPQDNTCPIAAFPDARPDAWYHDGVHWAIENSVMNGVGGGTFTANGITTRATVAQILWNLEGKPAANGTSEYNDVKSEAWYAPAVRWASAEGIVTGYAASAGNGMLFNPNGAVTREQLATMLFRYAQYKNIDVSVGEDTNILSYEDAFDISEWAMAALQWACGAGVLTGVSLNGTMYLLPEETATRAVVATMMQRFCTEIAK